MDYCRLPSGYRIGTSSLIQSLLKFRSPLVHCRLDNFEFGVISLVYFFFFSWSSALPLPSIDCGIVRSIGAHRLGWASPPFPVVYYRVPYSAIDSRTWVELHLLHSTSKVPFAAEDGFWRTEGERRGLTQFYLGFCSPAVNY